jgi:hypothetical protein
VDWTAQFVVDETVVHYVETKKDTANPQLMLTPEPIELDDELKDYFSKQVSERIESKSLEVVEDEDKDTQAPDAIGAILKDKAKLVEQSRILGTRLYEVQGGRESSGLLTVLTGTVSGKAAVAVVKLERQRGISFNIDQESGVVDLELLRNLTLTDKTKVYKTAVFVANKKKGLKLDGIVADSQRTSRTQGRVIADFFLKYLGCKPKEPAAEATFAFVKAANQAFDDVNDMSARGKYQVGLLAELDSTTADICPETFANKHIGDQTDRQNFIAHMEDEGLQPDKSFVKDTKLVKLDKFWMTFEGASLTLVGSQLDLDERVDMPANPGRTRPVKIRAGVKELTTGRK